MILWHHDDVFLQNKCREIKHEKSKDKNLDKNNLSLKTQDIVKF